MVGFPGSHRCKTRAANAHFARERYVNACIQQHRSNAAFNWNAEHLPGGADLNFEGHFVHQDTGCSFSACDHRRERLLVNLLGTPALGAGSLPYFGHESLRATYIDVCLPIRCVQAHRQAGP